MCSTYLPWGWPNGGACVSSAAHDPSSLAFDRRAFSTDDDARISTAYRAAVWLCLAKPRLLCLATPRTSSHLEAGRLQRRKATDSAYFTLEIGSGARTLDRESRRFRDPPGARCRRPRLGARCGFGAIRSRATSIAVRVPLHDRECREQSNCKTRNQRQQEDPTGRAYERRSAQNAGEQPLRCGIRERGQDDPACCHRCG